MVSRQETSRPLLTPGEIMQLPPDDEIVMVSGRPPVRAKKIRYYEDPELAARILSPPVLASTAKPPPDGQSSPDGEPPTDLTPKDWPDTAAAGKRVSGTNDADNAGIRREPELPEHEEIAHGPKKPVQEFDPALDDPDDEAERQHALRRSRQISLDDDDDV